MGSCSCFSNSNPEPIELSPENKLTIEKTLSKKSVQYLQTPYKVLPIPENIKEKLDKLPVFVFDLQKDKDFAGAKEDSRVFRSNYNDLIQGSWRDGQPCGPCHILYDKEEYYYEGYVKEGQPYKKGRLITRNQEVYEGEFKEDRLTLEGKYTDNAGLTIKGSFSKGLVQGEGEEKWENGTFYRGNYVDGVKTGQGVLIWENENKAKEEKYEGEFKENMFEGKGKYQWGAQKQYIGDWVNGMMDGEGVFTWKDGRIFKGSFKEDKKQGYGVLEWGDGRTWKGNWKEDKQDGVGYLKNVNGELQIGLWSEGQRVKWLTEEEAKEFQNKEKQ